MTEYKFQGFRVGTTQDYRGHETGEDFPVAVIYVGKNGKRVDIPMTEEQLFSHIQEAAHTLLLLRRRARNRGLK